MRIPAAVLVALAGALVLVSTATAKEVSKVQVCGASGCTTLDRDVGGSPAFMDGGPPSDPPREAAAWYSIRYTVSPGEEEDIKPFTFRNAYVPSADRLRVRGEGGRFEWLNPPDGFARAVEPALARVKPFPAARLRGLDVKPIEVRVDEVVNPPAADRETAPGGGGSAPWVWIGLAAAAAGVLAAAAERWRRRTRSLPAPGTSA